MSKSLYLFGNWKMYLDYQESVTLAQALKANQDSFPGSITMADYPNKDS